MNCRDSESLILAERDGVLTQEQHAGLSDHVAACGACRQFRADLAMALEAFKTAAGAIPVPDADDAWRELQAELRGTKTTRKRPLAPVIWFGTSLAAAAAIAFAFFVSRPTALKPAVELAKASLPAAPYDPSIIAGADYVEAGDPNASTMVYVDKDSGWLVVWAEDVSAETSG